MIYQLIHLNAGTVAVTLGCSQTVTPSGHLPSWPPAACLSDASVLGDVTKQHEKVGEVVDIESFRAAISGGGFMKAETGAVK